MNHLDVFFDVLIGSLKEDQVRRQSSRASSSRTDFSYLHDYNWQQIHSLNKAIFGSVFFKKLLCKKTTETSDDQLNNKNYQNKFENFAKLKGKVSIWKAKIKKQLKKIPSKQFYEMQYDLGVPMPLEHNKIQIKMIKQLIEEQECKGELINEKVNTLVDCCECCEKDEDDHLGNSTKEQLKGLELFFQSLIKSLHDFNDDEVLDLQMQILKYIKNIRERREIKLHLKRYCIATMKFSESVLKIDD